MPSKIKCKPKCNEWERRRREKLNDAFGILAQLLPNHDPAKPLPKIDILERSTDFVKELRLSNSRLVTRQMQDDEKCKLIKQLEDEVNKLILRVKQLTALLKTANIPIPAGPYIESLGKRKPKWAEELTLVPMEDASSATGKTSDEENNVGTNGNDDSDSSNGSGVNGKDADGQNSTEGRESSGLGSSTTPLKEVNASASSQDKGTPDAPANPSIKPAKRRRKAGDMSSKAKKMKKDTLNTDNDSDIQVIKEVPSTVSKKGKDVKSSTNSNNNNRAGSLQNGNIVVTSPTRSADPPLQIPITSSSGTLSFMTNISNPVTATTVNSASRILPMQTIILTSNSISTANLLNTPNTPLFTRFALPSAQLVPTFIQKIPILPIRKPIIKKKRKARKRRKLVIPNVEMGLQIRTEVVPNVLTDHQNHQEQPSAENTNTEVSVEQSVSIATQTVNDDVATQSSSEKSDKNLEEITSSESQETQAKNAPDPELMQIQFFAADEVVVSSATEQSAEVVTTSEKQVQEIDTNISEIGKSPEIAVPETNPRILTSTPIPVAKDNDNRIGQGSESITDVQGRKDDENENAISHTALSLIGMNMEIGLPTPNQDTNSSLSEEVTEKISECIARSMDLIDAQDGELMDLGENWGDTTNSPKSPVSPTQMFLSMFPLLPKENVPNVSEGSQLLCPSMTHTRHISGFSTQPHRSFFIDAMLPDDSLSQISHQPKDRIDNQPSGGTGNEKEKQKSTPSTSVSAIIPPSSNSRTNDQTNLAAVQKANNNNPGRDITKSSTKSSPSKALSSSSSVPLSSSSKSPAAESRKSIGFSLKDLNLFGDALDFNALHSFSYSQLDQDLFRDSSRSRGLLDNSFTFSFDQAQAATDLFPFHQFEPFETPTIPNLQLGPGPAPPIPGGNTYPSVNNSASTFPNFDITGPANAPAQVTSSSIGAETFVGFSQFQSSSSRALNTNEALKTSSVNVSAAATQSPMSSPTKSNTRAQPTQNISTGIRFSPAMSTASSTNKGTKRSDENTRNRSASQSQNRRVMSPAKTKEKSTLPREQPPGRSHMNQRGNTIASSDAQITSKSSSKNLANKRPVATPHKSRQPKDASNSADKQVSLSLVNSPQITVQGQAVRSRTDPVNDTTSSQSATINYRPAENIMNYGTSQIHQHATATPSRGISLDMFSSFPHHHQGSQMFGNQEQPFYDNIFQDFSFSSDCNPHYDNYNLDFSGLHSTGSGIIDSSLPQPQFNNELTGHQHSVQIQQNVQHRQSQEQCQNNNNNNISHSRSGRPTPFYLQDVNCENYNFSQTANNNDQRHQPLQSLSLNTESHSQPQRCINSQNQNQMRQQSSQNITGNNYEHRSVQQPSNVNIGANASISTRHNQPTQQPQYYGSTSSRQQQQICQQAQQQVNYPTHPQTGSANSRKVTHQPQHQQNQNQSQLQTQYVNPPMKAKQVASSSQVPQQPPSHQVVHSNNVNANNPSPYSVSTIPTSSSSVSHRPVNWMTGTQGASTSQRSTSSNPTSSNKSANSNNVSAPNPFSVSKLVGLGNNSGANTTSNLNNSTSSSVNSTGNVVNQNPMNPNRQSRSSNNYCAEALIRKNPTNPGHSSALNWPAPLSHSPRKNHALLPNSPVTNTAPVFNPNTYSIPGNINMTNAANNSADFGGTFSVSQPSNLHHGNFETFPVAQSTTLQPSGNSNNMSYQIHNTNHPQTGYHNQFQDQMGYNQNATSSISNFNLSSIFPEMNEKRQQYGRGSGGGGLGQLRPPASNSSSGNNSNRHPAAGNSVNPSSSATSTNSNSTSNNCGYYTTQSQKPQGRESSQSK